MIRVILILLFIGSANLVNAQTNISADNECDSMIRVEMDKMTNRPDVSGRQLITLSTDDGKTGVQILPILNRDKHVVLAITVFGKSACLDEKDQVIFLFRDKKRTTVNNSAPFNCQGTVLLLLQGMLGKKKILNDLISKEIEAIRVPSGNISMDFDLTVDQSVALKKMITCLANYR